MKLDPFVLPSKRKREEPDSEETPPFIPTREVMPECSPLIPEHSLHTFPFSAEHLELLANLKNHSSSFSAAQATEVLHSFQNKTPQPFTNVSQFSILFVYTPQDSYPALFNDNSVSKFINSAPNTYVPLQSFSTLQSNTPTLPSMHTNACGHTSQPGTTDEPKYQRPPKRSKLEKDISKIRKDLSRLFEGCCVIFRRSKLFG